MKKAAAFTARLSLTRYTQARGPNNAGNEERSQDGVAADQGATFSIDPASDRGVDIARKGESPGRGSGTAKASRIIPMEASITVSTGGAGELETFGEEGGYRVRVV